MICPKCGAAISDYKPFCKYCGEYIASYSSSADHSPPPTIAKPERLPRQINPIIILASVGGLAVILLSIVLGVLLGQRTVEPEIDTLAITAPTTSAPTEQMVAPTPEPALAQDIAEEQLYAPQSARRYKDAIPEDGLEDMILQGYYRKFSYSELYGFSQSEVALLRNGMYALSGKIFEKQVNSNYFSSRSWYTPFQENVYGYMNDYQTANISLCVQYEKDNGWR